MILLIAYGNELRQDDGAGLRLAELMARRWQAVSTPLRHLTVQQLTPELALEIADPGVTAVVFVDTRAVAPGDEATGAAEAVTVTPLAAPDASSPSLGHHFQPDVLLAYAALFLENQPAPPAWLATVPGVAFDHGEGLSPIASAAIEAAFDDETQPLPRLMARLAE
ncbi:MAG TPA: hydrogenase maturation protease [Anaerolineae bacterium]|nr:hydrogenase maturation protease [Anaerolineae bacterium]